MPPKIILLLLASSSILLVGKPYTISMIMFDLHLGHDFIPIIITHIIFGGERGLLSQHL
tara:strand:- start:1388 stop:1564 length:177 start_codon:yes stop_codon:yes gene_type:complete